MKIVTRIMTREKSSEKKAARIVTNTITKKQRE